MTAQNTDQEKEIAPEGGSKAKDASTRKLTYLELGIAVGTALGIVFNNIPIGIALGLVVGLVSGQVANKGK